MSSPTDRPDKPDDQIAEGEFPQRNEQSVPKEGPISDQARAHRPLDTASLRETEPPPAPRALGRLAVLAGLVIAASIGAAIPPFAPRVRRRTRDPSARIQHAPRRFAMQVSALRLSAG